MKAARPLVAAYGVAVAVVALWLWGLQTAATTQACTVPGCGWPELSAAGFDSVEALGLPAWSWTAFAATLSAIWIGVPFALGVLTLRARRAPAYLPVLWFTFALGTVSGVPSGVWGTGLRVLTLGSWFTLFALFPTGTFRPRWVAAAPATAVIWTIVMTLPPVAAREAANDPLWWALEAAIYLVCVGIVVAAQVVQFRRGDAVIRRQISLVLLVFAIFVAGGIANALLNLRLDPSATGYGSLGGALLYEASGFMTILLIGCVAIAMLRDGAYGIRVAVDRALAATIALLIAGFVYATVVAIASAVVSGWAASAVAAIATAAALAGAYARIARTVGRLVYGDADDPSAVAAALDARIVAVDDPDRLLSAIAETLATRLRFPAVRLTGLSGTPAGDDPPDDAVRRERVPLELDDRPLGFIEVTLRPRQRRLTARDRDALAAAAGPVAAASTALRLTEQLRQSRLEVLIGRDEERRALRRRLHDEIGPTLALAGHRIAAAHTDPGQLDAAAATVTDAVAQVRSISRELRPPALDDLGLRAALAQFADGLAIEASVTGPDRVEPGIVEVALYRIAVEALLNAVRHARASRVEVRLTEPDGGWRLDVDDDGIGLPADTVPGVGLLAMRERADELGGTLTVGPSGLGGTRVRADLPALPREEP